MEVGLDPGDIVLGTPLPPEKGAQHPQFSANGYFGQTAGWIRIPLGTEVGLGPGHIVLDGDPSPPKGAHPHFGPCLLWPNCGMSGSSGRTPKTENFTEILPNFGI